MKTFKQHLRENTTGSGVIPVFIHFKHVPMVDITEGVVPVPIHYKYIPTVDKKYMLKEEFEMDDSLPPLQHYINDVSGRNVDNLLPPESKVKNSEAVSNLLHRDNAFTKEHHDAIYDYTGGGSADWNRHLLQTNGTPNHFQAEQRKINDLTDAIHNNRIQHKVDVWSGAGFDPEKYLDEKKQLRSPAFISTSLEFGTAHQFVAQKDPIGDHSYNGHRREGVRHIIHFELHPDDPASPIALHSEYPPENEVALQRGLKYQWHGVTKYKDEGFGHYHIHKMSVAKDEDV